MQKTLNKHQRIKGELQVSQLFKQGKTIIAYPIRICYLSSNTDQNQILVSVPKRLFKRAVKRNLLKRRMREAYRLNQHLLENKENRYKIAFMYMSAEVFTFEQIQHSMIKGLQRL